MRDFTQDIRDVQRRLDEAATYLSIDDNRERFAVLEAEVAEPGLWDDQERAKKLNAEYANVRDDLSTFDDLTERVADVEVLHELARDEDDESSHRQEDPAPGPPPSRPAIAPLLQVSGEKKASKSDGNSTFTTEHPSNCRCISSLGARLPNCR